MPEHAVALYRTGLSSPHAFTTGSSTRSRHPPDLHRGYAIEPAERVTEAGGVQIGGTSAGELDRNADRHAQEVIVPSKTPSRALSSTSARKYRTSPRTPTRLLNEFIRPPPPLNPRLFWFGPLHWSTRESPRAQQPRRDVTSARLECVWAPPRCP